LNRFSADNFFPLSKQTTFTTFGLKFIVSKTELNTFLKMGNYTKTKSIGIKQLALIIAPLISLAIILFADLDPWQLHC